MGVGASAVLAVGLYPFGGFLKAISILAVGFFTRGFFISSLIYLNEIGGDNFKSWSMLIIFGLWAFSPLLNSLESKIGLDRWEAYYFCVFCPCLIGSYFILQGPDPSPHHLYFKSKFVTVQSNLPRLEWF